MANNSNSSSNNSSNSGGMNFTEGFGSNIGGNFGTTTGGSTNSSTGTSQSSGGSQGNSMNYSKQSVWGEQSPYLQDVYENAQDAYGNTQGQINALTPQVQDQMSQAFNQAQGGYGNQMGGGFASGLQGQIGANSYVDAMKGQVADDANRLKQQNLGSLDARAAAAGMSGSSGYRDQVGNMMESVDDNAMDQMANIGYQAHNQGIQNQMNLAGMMDSNQQGAMNSMNAMQQGAMNQFNPAMMGQQAAQNYAQTIGGPTVLGTSFGQSDNSSFNNSTSNNSSTGSSFNNGMNIGLNMGGSVNTGGGVNSSAGNGTSNSNSWSFQPPVAPPSSDMRLKENIEHVDQIDGVNLYTWDWRDDAPVTSPMNYGVIAQEVAHTHPEAVVEGEHGYLTVDYSKLGRAGQAALARMGEAA